MTARPASVTAILALTVFQVLLAWAFYVGLSSRPDLIPGIHGPDITDGILVAASTYTLLSIPIIASVLRRNRLVVRVCLALNVLVSLPIQAIIGVLLSSIAFGLTFRRAAGRYFGAAQQPAPAPAL